MKLSTTVILLCLAFASNVLAQTNFEKVPMAEDNWQILGTSVASFDTVAGRPAIVLRGNLTAKTPAFSNGTIEVDILANQKRSFAGITFHKKDGSSEEVYLRMHKSGQPDAVQYTPIHNNESNWQLYDGYQTSVTMHKTGWNTLRVVVQDERADIYVNDIKVISVDELKTDNSSGGIGLFSLFENRFSNFRYSNEEVDLPDFNLDNKNVQEGLITEWALTEAIIFDENPLDISALSKLATTKAKTERSGLLPISKYKIRSTAGNFEGNPEFYVVASHDIEVLQDETQMFSFDYSDKIIVYLNGQKIFHGNNAFRAKGIQYKGNLNIDTNRLFLPLTKGTNKLQCIVIDRANGWGLIGKLE